MKRQFYYLSYVWVVLLAATMFLSGCGSNPSSGSGQNNDTGSSSSSSDSGNQQAAADYPKMTIKFSHVAAEDTPKGKAALKFKEVVEAKSGGNIQVQVYPNGQLYGDKDEIQALQANNVHFIAPSSSKLAGFDKSFELFDLPFLFKNDEHLYKFEDGDAGKQLLVKLDSKGMVGVAFWPNGFKHITNSKREIAKPEDVKGLKIRTHGGDIINDVYAQLGAASTKIAFNDVYQALQLGTVDGQENSLVNIQTQRYDEVQKYLTLTNHARSEYVVVTNKQWWDGLDQNTQALLTEAMKEATQVGRDEEKKLEDEALETIKSNGKMKVNELTDGELQAFKDALKPVFDKWSPQLDTNLIKAVNDLGK